MTKANHYRPHTPRLERVELTLDFTQEGGHDLILSTATGSSQYRRRSLWHEQATWSDVDSDLRHEPADWLHHIALTAIQDHPNTQERLLFGLTGGLGVQGSLF